MSKTKIILAVSSLILTTLACNAFNELVPTSATPNPTYVIVEPTFPPTQSDAPLTEASVPRVSIEETRVALAAGAAIIVDVRGPQAYDVSHIPGALNIQLGEFETNPTGLDLAKDQWIITYCS